MSLLEFFMDHVAPQIWMGEGRDALKCICHCWKVPMLLDDDEDSYAWVLEGIWESWLEPQMRTSFGLIDHGLLSAFSERWHKETYSFHLPVGEMTVTLDNVSCLSHLPIIGCLLDHTSLSRREGVKMLETLLGVTHEVSRMEYEATRCANVHLSWL